MYGIEDPSFDGGRQQGLIKEAIGHINDHNADAYSMTISKYN
jgi:hypothetical protein